MFSRLPTALFAFALLSACATQSPDGDFDADLDAASSSTTDVSQGFDLQDPFDSTPSTDTPKPTDSSLPPLDSGVETDVPVATKDLGLEDLSPVTDAPFFVDVVTDTGPAITDTGPACATSETRCGDACVNLSTSTTHCGACGNVCNETENCTAGTCRAPCTSPMSLCAGACVDTRNSNSHCGTCGHACASGQVCTMGSCTSSSSCPAQHLDCNGMSSDGCEIDLGAASNQCPAAENLGAFCGDTSCGFLCGGTSTYTPVTRTGHGSRWFKVTMQECSNCPASLSHTVSLEVPAEIDYDLFAYSACGSLIGSSREVSGRTDTLTITRSETPASSDTVSYWIEVRFYSGASCSPWRLTLRTRSRGAGSC